ncbi:MAG: hypothetical protein GY915_07775 [bacterium]|nr:hypothetical protein [bacterium]
MKKTNMYLAAILLGLSFTALDAGATGFANEAEEAQMMNHLALAQQFRDSVPLGNVDATRNFARDALASIPDNYASAYRSELENYLMAAHLDVAGLMMQARNAGNNALEAILSVRALELLPPGFASAYFPNQ